MLSIEVAEKEYNFRIENDATGLYASFLKGQGHQGIFSLAKGTL